MVIREFRITDMDEVLDIWLDASIQAHDFIPSSCWRSQLSAMRELYLPNARTIVYEKDGVPQGFCSLAGHRLAALFVKPEYQGMGIGSQLLNDVLTKHEGLELSVYSANTPSVRFYMKHGFRVIREQVDEHTGEPETVMRYTAQLEKEI